MLKVSGNCLSKYLTSVGLCLAFWGFVSTVTAENIAIPELKNIVKENPAESKFKTEVIISVSDYSVIENDTYIIKLAFTTIFKSNNDSKSEGIIMLDDKSIGKLTAYCNKFIQWEKDSKLNGITKHEEKIGDLEYLTERDLQNLQDLGKMETLQTLLREKIASQAKPDPKIEKRKKQIDEKIKLVRKSISSKKQAVIFLLEPTKTLMRFCLYDDEGRIMGWEPFWPSLSSQSVQVMKDVLSDEVPKMIQKLKENRQKLKLFK
jgi:hypothetical protein